MERATFRKRTDAKTLIFRWIAVVFVVWAIGFFFLFLRTGSWLFAAGTIICYIASYVLRFSQQKGPKFQVAQWSFKIPHVEDPERRKEMAKAMEKKSLELMQKYQSASPNDPRIQQEMKEYLQETFHLSF